MTAEKNTNWTRGENLKQWRGLALFTLRQVMEADHLQGEKEMDFEKPINFREKVPRCTWQSDLRSTPTQEQSVPGLS